MGKLKQLTETSYFVMTDNGDKVGILIDYECQINPPENKSGLELILGEESFTFQSIQEMSEALQETYEVLETEKVEIQNSTKELDGYPVNDTDTILDVQIDENTQLSTFRKSKRSKKRFYAGWFITKSENGSFLPRLTISTEIYQERKDSGECLGPFKTYMELTVEMNQLNK